MPSNIFRSMMSEPGSIGIMPMRAASSERREAEAVAADQPSGAVVRLQHEGPDPVAVLGSPGEHVPGFDPLEPHSVRAKGDCMADLGMLELGQDVVDAMHVEAEQVPDPVGGVGAAAR